MNRVCVHETHIARISRRDADDFLARFEILGNVGLGVWHWGLLHRKELVSVITFGTPCFGGRRGWIARAGDTYGARVFQLCRGGTLPNAPKGAPSRAISLASKAMRELHGPFIAVAYADETLGEIGTIYQASGALYTGMTKPKGQANYMIYNKLMSAWSVRRNFGTRDKGRLAQFDPNVKVILLKPKHRYLFVSAPKQLKKRIVNALEAYVFPYPKRNAATAEFEFSPNYVKNVQLALP